MTRKITSYMSILLITFLLGNTPNVFAGFINTSHWNDLNPTKGQPNSGGWKSVYGGASIDSETDTPDSSPALRFTYPIGFRTGDSPDKVWYPIPSSATELWFQYYFKYSSNFAWNSTGQKLNFVYTKNSNFLINTMWGGREIHMLNQITFGRGTQSFASKASIEAGRWYKLKVHAVMNTVGKSDGIIQVWLNDNLIINANSVMYRNEDIGWNAIAFDPTYGGGGTDVPRTCYLWIDYSIVSTEPIGATAPPPPPSNSDKVPLAPTYLKIIK